MFKDGVLIVSATMLSLALVYYGVYQANKYVKQKECVEYATIEKVETKMLTDACYIKDTRNGWMKLEAYLIRKTLNTGVIKD